MFRMVEFNVALLSRIDGLIVDYIERGIRVFPASCMLKHQSGVCPRRHDGHAPITWNCTIYRSFCNASSYMAEWMAICE
jgi:hypothetical protein